MLFGSAADDEPRGYEERIEAIDERIEEFVKEFRKKEETDALDEIDAILSDLGMIYMEIGLQAGIRLMMDMEKQKMN